MLEKTLASKELIESCNAWKESLTKDQQQLIKNWTGSNYRDINNTVSDWLGGDHHPRDTYAHETDDLTVDFLLTLCTAPEYDGCIWRGTSKNDFSVGQVLDFKRLQSWSINPLSAKPFAREEGVLYRAKTRGFYIDGLSDYGRKRRTDESCEEEVIVMPSSAVVTNIEKMIDVEKKEVTRSAHSLDPQRLRQMTHDSYRGYSHNRKRPIQQKTFDFDHDKTDDRKLFFHPFPMIENKRKHRSHYYRRTARVIEISWVEIITTIVDLEITEKWN